MTCPNTTMDQAQFLVCCWENLIEQHKNEYQTEINANIGLNAVMLALTISRFTYSYFQEKRILDSLQNAKQLSEENPLTNDVEDLHKRAITRLESCELVTNVVILTLSLACLGLSAYLAGVVGWHNRIPKYWKDCATCTYPG